MSADMIERLIILATGLGHIMIGMAVFFCLLLLILSMERRRWHVIYPNGVCSCAMLHSDALNLAIKFKGRISKS